MITGNQTWQAALAPNQKQPLYVLVIPNFGLYLASFSAGAGVVIGGFGIGVYGLAPYGA
jgi:hypothetical protein